MLQALCQQLGCTVPNAEAWTYFRSNARQNGSALTIGVPPFNARSEPQQDESTEVPLARDEEGWSVRLWMDPEAPHMSTAACETSDDCLAIWNRASVSDELNQSPACEFNTIESPRIVRSGFGCTGGYSQGFCVDVALANSLRGQHGLNHCLAPQKSKATPRAL